MRMALIGALVALSLLSTDCSVFSGRHRVRLRDAQGMAKNAVHIMNPSVAYDQSWNEQLDLPRSLRNKDAVVLFLLTKAVEIDQEVDTGAYYYLGVFFLDKDCDLARYYLSEHLRFVPGDQHTARLAAILEDRGCDHVVSDHGFDLDEDVQFRTQ